MYASRRAVRCAIRRLCGRMYACVCARPMFACYARACMPGNM